MRAFGWYSHGMTEHLQQRAKLPEIVESYKDFSPPAPLRPIIEELLHYVPAEYLVGLRTILLTNQGALNRSARRKTTWGRKRRVILAEALGYYSQATRSATAFICLHVDNILEGCPAPALLLHLPFIRYVLFVDVLYHEIGHHIHKTCRPVFEGSENVAENWSRKLGREFFRKKYGYLRPIAKVLAPAVSLLGRLKRRD
jgi:hypothetical protein